MVGLTIVCLKYKKSEHKDVITLFLVLYFLENFLINFMDFAIVRSVFSEYYHDDLFLDSFSFRTF